MVSRTKYDGQYSTQFREALFKAICTDNLKEVKSLLANFTRDIDTICFGVYLAPEVTHKRYFRQNRNISNNNEAIHAVAKERFLAYGAQRLDSLERRLHRDKAGTTSSNFQHLNTGNNKWTPPACIRNGATPQHVAVWKNSLKVAEYFCNLGASTNTCDACGISVYDRASSREMRAILRRPSMPKRLDVVFSSNGRAVIEFDIMESQPRVEVYEIKERFTQQVWRVSTLDGNLRIFARDSRRDGAKTLVFETPCGVIHSNKTHLFSVRAQNIDGFWSLWFTQKTPLKARHWLEEWNDEHELVQETNQSKLSEEKLAPNELKELKLGQISFGLVNSDNFFLRALEEQNKAASKIQALGRGIKAKRSVKALREKQTKENLRSVAAKAIQNLCRQRARSRLNQTASDYESDHIKLHEKISMQEGKYHERKQRKKLQFSKNNNFLERERLRLKFIDDHGMDVKLN